nr:glutathione binding-like protein [Acanthopleuribacter pedis]
MHHPQSGSFQDKIAERRPGGLKALAMMENHLAKNDFMVGDGYSVADIALYAYTHKADEGGFALADYPAVSAWVARVAAQPRHITIEEKTNFTGT